jgi:lantibiotic transport system ATP-binding protein
MKDIVIQDNAIVTRNLDFSYGKIQALKNVNMEIPKGSIYGFLGPNGAGKTTMIKVMLGLLTPSHGSVEIFNCEFGRHRVSVLEDTGSTVEAPSLYPALNGYENVEIVRILRGLEKSETWRVIDTVNLRKDAKRKVSQYSTGMKQRLALAIAILGNPGLIILDEPMNGLDPSGIIEIREFLLRINRESGTSVFISSHILGEIEKMASHIGIIDRGVLKFQGPYREIARKFASKNVHLITGNNALAFKSLTEAGISVEFVKNELYFHASSEADVASVIRKLAGEGIDIFEVTPATNDLEDIFIDIINN